MSIKGGFFSFLNCIFPLVSSYRANKIILNRISSLENETDNTEYMNNFANSPLTDVERVYRNVAEYRKSLTDKAKVNVFGITMAVILIVGMANVFSSMACPTDLHIVYLLSMMSIFIALFYMILSGLVSLHSLQGQKTFDLTPTDYSYLTSCNTSERKSEKVFLLAKCAELNCEINLTINNMVTASYSFLRNGLLFLFLSSALIGYISYRNVSPAKLKNTQVEECLDKNIRWTRPCNEIITIKRYNYER